MKVSKLFKEDRPVFSYEVFPPKKTSSIEMIYGTLEELKDLNPDFISVTYGAGGSGANTLTCDVAAMIKNKFGIEAVAHLTCVNNTRETAEEMLKRLESDGVENVLALRGDINPDIPPLKEFVYASDLVAYIKERGGFDIAGACYPECHYECDNIDEDIKNLKKKVDAGAEHLVSQLFFDNDAFYDFERKARAAGIDVPIEAGIMPVTNKSQIERMVSMCGASMPAKLSRIMQRYENNPEALRDAGIAYAVNQIIDLIANGVDGVHLYTMNNPYVARKITESIGNVLRAND